MQKMMFELEVCPAEGCNRPQHTRGFCKMHYNQKIRAREIQPTRIVSRHHKRKCHVDGCTSKASALGYCGMHYHRIKKHGDPHWDLQKTLEVKEQQTEAALAARLERRCTVEGCTNKDYEARGYCRTHYKRWSRYGDPLFLKREAYEGAEKNESGMEWNENRRDALRTSVFRSGVQGEGKSNPASLVSKAAVHVPVPVLDEPNRHGQHERHAPKAGLVEDGEHRRHVADGRPELQTGGPQGLTITIPAWLLWVIGVPLGLIFFVCAVFGALFLWNFRN